LEVIHSFRGKATRAVFERTGTGRFPPEIQRNALMKLLLIDAAETLEDLKIPPSNHLEKLKGDRKGQYSIRINQQWRICFEWQGSDALEVEIVDYH
jgi:proteic killer suppression protein